MTALLYITNARIPTEKAHGLQILKTVEALAKEGAAVRLVVPRRKNPITNDAFAFYGVEKIFTVEYLPDTLRFLEGPVHDLYFILQRSAFGLQAFLLALRAQERVIYTRDITLAFFLSVFSKKTIVYEDHEPKRSFGSLYRLFLRHIDKKVVVSKLLTLLYERFGIAKESYLFAHNGVELSDFDGPVPPREGWREIGVDPERRIALYVGHLYAWKGVYTLLEAAALAPEFHVVLVGGTAEDSKSAAAYIREKNIRNVTLVHFLSHARVTALMRIADVLVLPNTGREERSYKYTTPLKLFEYMAAGVPIVASALPSIKAYLDDATGFFFAPDDPAALAAALREALGASDAKERAARAEAAVREWTWQHRAQQILEFIG